MQQAPGLPKGCVLQNGQYVASAYLQAAHCAYGSSTTVYTCLPLFHINAQNYSLLSVLAAGGSLALDSRFSASGFCCGRPSGSERLRPEPASPVHV
jgi:crotonobetaine/carnitine-CoA ligase